MTAPPGRTVFRSSRHVAALNATRMSTLSDRAMCPSGVMRSWYQVGRPSMLEGNTFLGATGIPMWKMALVSTRLAVWLPDPLTVAAWMVRSLTMGSVTWGANSGFYAPAHSRLDSLESSIREGRDAQGAVARRASRCTRARYRDQADRRQARRRRRGRRGSRRLHQRRRLPGRRGQSRDPRGRPAPGCAGRAEGPGADAERGHAAGEGRAADQLPAAGDPGR